MDTHTHGHHESVIDHHGARTAENSAGFLIPHLQRGTTILDVGCGPGSITVDLARRVHPGHVVGVDVSSDVVELAVTLASDLGVTNVAFRQGSAYELSDLDQVFDVVYAHQTLQHLTDPVRALIEMGDALAPDGIVGVRDADYASMIWAPQHPMLTRWLELYHEVTARNDAEADAGRYLLGWLQAAGLASIEITTSTWSYADDEGRRWWGLGWSRRALESSFALQALDYELTDSAELGAISDALRWWSAQPDGFFALMHTEAIGRW